MLLAGAIATPALGTWFEEFKLRIKPELENELNYLANNEFAVNPQARAIGSGCTSPLVDWSTEKIREMGYDTYKELYDNKILQMPYIYKHYIDKNEDEEYFGYDGMQTKELIMRHHDAMVFWTEADIDNSIKTDDILLLAMHGSDLMDNSKLVPTIMRLFDFDNVDDVLAFATKVQEFVEKLPGGQDNPLLTMNAIATRAANARDPSRQSKDSIIIGDGVLQFLADTGVLKSSGPDFVHAHEFGHHIQFEMDLVVPPGSGFEDDTRRKELMSDAISAYFLAHDRGGNMVAEEINVFDMTAYSTGDCSVGIEDHHGTPEQRKCAAVWGASQAAPNLPLIDPEAFVHLFNDAYLGILNLDRQECTLILEDPTLDEPVVESEIEEPMEEQLSEESVIEHNHNNDWEDEFTTEDEPSDVPIIDIISMIPMKEDISKTLTGSTLDSDSPDETNYQPLAQSSPVHVPDVLTETSNGSSRHRGVPSETQQSFMTYGYTLEDCSLPWVYCSPVSSSTRSVSVSCSSLVAHLVLTLLISLGNTLG